MLQMPLIPAPMFLSRSKGLIWFTRQKQKETRGWSRWSGWSGCGSCWSCGLCASFGSIRCFTLAGWIHGRMQPGLGGHGSADVQSCLALVVKTFCQDRNYTFPDGISTEYKDMQDCTVAQFLLVCRWRPRAAVAWWAAGRSTFVGSRVLRFALCILRSASPQMYGRFPRPDLAVCTLQFVDLVENCKMFKVWSRLVVWVMI